MKRFDTPPAGRQTVPVTALADIFPPFGLRIRCAELELRLPTDADLPGLIELAARGVHGPDEMPFSHPWTAAAPEDLPADFVRFDARTRQITPENWALELMTLERGLPVGRQAVSGADFRRLKAVQTGSWVGLEHHGRGIGTLMRQMVLCLAFDELGAEIATTEAYIDNGPSNGVSRRLGYRENGIVRVARGDGWEWQQRYLLTPDDFVRPDVPVEYEGVAPLRRFLGLDA